MIITMEIENAVTSPINAAMEAMIVTAIARVKEGDAEAAWGSGALAGTVTRGELIGIQKSFVAVLVAQGFRAVDAKAFVEIVTAQAQAGTR